MASFDCNNYKNLSEILKTDSQTDLTNLFRDCPNACSYAYGDGNPDLSGIGVMISYISQAALTAVFGVLLLVICFFAKQDYLDSLARMADRFILASALFTSPIMLASIFRFQLYPSVFELAFMRQVTNMESYCTVALLFIAAGAEASRSDSLWERNFRWRTERDFKRQKQDSGGSSGPRAARAVWSAHLKRSWDSFRRYVMVPSGVGRAVRISMLLCVLANAVLLICIYRMELNFGQKITSELWSESCSEYPRLPGYIDFSLFWLLGAACLAVLCVSLAVKNATRAQLVLLGVLTFDVVLVPLLAYTIYSLLNLRSHLTQDPLSGSGQNSWEFGQVLSVFVWVPTVVDILIWLTKSIYRRKGEMELNSSIELC